MRLTLLLLLVAGSQAFATTPTFNFKCETNPKTTSFTFEESGDQVVLTTLHANGVDFMPVHDGIIVPHDLPYLTDVSTMLKHMGATNRFHFPKSKCKSYGAGVISCSGGDVQTLGGVKMEALNVITEKITTQVFSDKVESIKVILDVNIDGFVPVQELTMEYDPTDCK